jgi:hypothetical protein
MLASRAALVKCARRWSSQGLVDTLSLRLLSRFELLGTHAA